MLELDADDIMLGEVTPAELEAEAEALLVDVELEFAELEDAAEELDEAGAQAGRAVTARDAANSAATGRLREELQRVRDEAEGRTGGLTARCELASRLDLEGAAATQAAAATTALVLGSGGSIEEDLRCTLVASMEEIMWAWLNRSAQVEAREPVAAAPAVQAPTTTSDDAGLAAFLSRVAPSISDQLADNLLDTADTDFGLGQRSSAALTSQEEEGTAAKADNGAAPCRQWVHNLGVACSDEGQTCTAALRDLTVTAEANFERMRALRTRIAELRECVATRMQIVGLEQESKTLMQTLASLRHKCIDKTLTAQAGESKEGGRVSLEEMKEAALAIEAKLQAVRQEHETKSTAFIRALPQRTSIGTGSVRPAAAVAEREMAAKVGLVSTGTDCQVEFGNLTEVK